jgi:hypothetical protein
MAVLESLATVHSRSLEASMRLLRLCTPRLSVIGVLAIMFVLSLIVSAQRQPSPSKKTKSGSCTHDDSGLKLPQVFAPRYLLRGLGTRATWWSVRAEWFTSTPGRETTTTSTNRMMGDFWWLFRTRRALEKRT